MSETMERFEALRVEVEAMQARMKQTAQDLVKNGAAAIFQEYGDIVYAFGWRQYTPYFNDGEPCEFGMGELSILGRADMEDAPEDEYELANWFSENDVWYGGTESFRPWSSNSRLREPRYKEASDAIEALYKVLSYNDLAKEVFGDHVSVLFKESGIEVEEYDHE